MRRPCSRFAFQPHRRRIESTLPPAADRLPASPKPNSSCGEIAYLVVHDIETAKRHFHSAARRGHPKAQHRLATIYSEEQAYSIAIKWCRLAAWQGRLPEAQYDLARMYYYGQGVTRDVRNRGNGCCRLRRRQMWTPCTEWEFFATDPVQAYAWFKLAALRKSADAAKAARELRASMTGEQVEQAKR